MFKVKSIFGKRLFMNWNDVIHILIDNARNYFVLAGLGFLIFYVVLKRKYFSRRYKCSL